MSVRQQMARGALIYTATNILQKGVTFLLLPIYTHYLSPSDYGVLSVVTALTGVFSILFTLSLHGAMTRFYFTYQDEPAKLKEFWGTMLVFIFLISLTGIGCLLLTGPTVLAPLLGGVPFWPFVALGVVTVIFQPFFSIFLSLLQTREQSARYACYSVSQFIFNLTLVIFLVVCCHRGSQGVLTATLITAITFFVVSIYALRGQVTFCLRWQYLREALQYSLPLVPHSLSGQVLSMADKMFLNSMINTATAGLYNIGYMFGGIMGIIADSINRAYVPASMQVLTRREPAQLVEMQNAGLLLVVFYCLLASGLSIFAQEWVQIFTSTQFHRSSIVIPYIAFGFVLNGIYCLLVNILFFTNGATKFIALGTVVGGIANIVLNYVMIAHLGLIGAALAMLLAQGISTILIGLIGSRYEAVRWDYFRIGAIFLLSLMVSLAMNFLPWHRIKVILLVKAASFLALFYVLNIFAGGHVGYLIKQVVRYINQKKWVQNR